MFTGLVEETGTIQAIKKLDGSREFLISAQRVCQDLKTDDSVAVNGVCLTVTHMSSDTFTASAVSETLNRTTLSHLKIGTAVNLERALRLSDRLGGHWVQGHVDGTASVRDFQKLGATSLLTLQLPDRMIRYCVEKGSITVDGVSLTIAAIVGQQIRLAVIPHTFQHTTLKFLRRESTVNIELDILAKYVARILGETDNESHHDETWYRSHGY
jgi:riboflavin synthase